MLDFTELSVDGEDLEQLVRELCLALDYRVRWSGRGADSGRDLLEETGDALLGSKTRHWLVSCQHTALANGGTGRAVSGSKRGYQLDSINARLDAAASIKLPGGFTWYFDYLYDVPWTTRELEDPPYSQEQLAEMLGDGSVTYGDGQWDNFEIVMRRVDRGRDGYDADHYSYYEDVPEYV